jgi:hypothetical protein
MGHRNIRRRRAFRTGNGSSSVGPRNTIPAAAFAHGREVNRGEACGLPLKEGLQ